MFDLDQFIADCTAAVKREKSQTAVGEVVARAVADPAGVLRALGEPTRGEIQKLYQSDDLTILNVIWTPCMTLQPHDQNAGALNGIYRGPEDKVFQRRL